MHFTSHRDRPVRLVSARAGITPLMVALALTACGSGSDEPTEADFKFTEADLERAATGTYEGAIEHPDGTTRAVSWTLEREPSTGTAADALDVQPQCGTVSRDLSATIDPAAPLELMCATMYETTMPVTGTAAGDSIDTTVTGSVYVRGLTLENSEWEWILELGDGSRLWGYGPDTVSGDWRNGDELLGTFEVTKVP